ncbi:MAG TPA: DUF1634 domain-containing protein [Thermoplasmata archaeon]|jgi:uncharacterized membrane protein|nr:DUF1634 domain-containing protein [Thermoplasmata archaeon]
MTPDEPAVIEPPRVHRLPDEAYTRMTLVLRLGLGISLAVLLGGLVAYVLAYPGTSSQSVLAHNPILSYLSLSGLGAGLAAGSIGAVLTLGLIVLVATPIVRVVSGLYYFRKVGERAMTAITFTVLVLLLLGLLVIGPHIR